MKSLATVFLSCALVSCASQTQTVGSDMAPYKAVVAIEWQSPQSISATGATEEQSDASTSAKWFEEQIIDGLRRDQVFSDCVRASRESVEQTAEKENADLIVVVRAEELGKWTEEKKRSTGLGAVDVTLWFGLGVFSWFIPDISYGTRSSVIVQWKRPVDFQTKTGGREQRPGGTQQDEFVNKETLNSGSYALSLWDRAGSPLMYLATLVFPPIWMPFEDEEARDRALRESALETVKFELARKLGKDSIGSAGAPFRFRLLEPNSSAEIPTGSLRFRFSYTPVTGWDEGYRSLGMRRLEIHVKKGENGQYVLWKPYDAAARATINDKIARDAADNVVEESIDLGPGSTYVRFVAYPEYNRLPLTNTVVFRASPSP